MGPGAGAYRLENWICRHIPSVDSSLCLVYTHTYTMTSGSFFIVISSVGGFGCCIDESQVDNL